MMRFFNKGRVRCGCKLAICAAVTLLGSAHAGRSPTSMIPISREIELDLTDTVSPAIKLWSAKLYDFVRGRLISGGVDYRISIQVLSSITRHGSRDFDKYSVSNDADASPKRPSVLNQLCWRHELEAIASDAETKFALRFGARPTSRQGDTDIQADVPALDNRLLTRVARAARGALAGLGELRMACTRSPVHSVGVQAKWKHAVRIAPTGVQSIDDRIATALRTIKIKVPNAPIDAASFPAAAGTQNLYFGPQNVTFSTFYLDDAIRSCLKLAHCVDIRHMVGGNGRINIASTFENRTDFFENLYFSRPYNLNFGRPTALVQLSSEGEIAGAICGSEARERDNAEEQSRILSCLAQALGAYPAEPDRTEGYDADHEARLIPEEFIQLNKIYR